MHVIQLGVVVGSLAGFAGAQDNPLQHVFTFRGDDLLDHRGTAVATLPDLNGDGRQEIAVGVPRTRAGGAGTVEVHDGATGVVLYRVEADPLADSLSDRFGSALVVLPDVDKDNVADLAIGAPRDDDGGPDSGTITVVSGLDGMFLHRFVGLPEERLGAVLTVADVDADGRADLVAGAPGAQSVVVFSSAWLESTVALEPPAGSEVLLALSGDDGFGEAISGLSDLTGDGAEELAVGIPGADFAGSKDVGAIQIHSGGSGALLHRIEGGQALAGRGAALARLSSVDGDAWDELLVGAPFHDGAAGEDTGRVAAIAGDWLRQHALGGNPAGDGELFAVEGGASFDRYGRAVVGLADADGDGLADFGVGAPRAAALAGGGTAQLLSGADGSVLWTQGGAGVGELAGWALAGGDVTGDGLDDLVVGAPRDGGLGGGAATVVASVERRMAADGHLLSVVDGGLVQLSLQGPPEVAGQFYFVLGTASGTSPGLPSPAGVLPINFDGYSIYTLTPTPDLTNFWGTLDASASASASVFLPSGSSPTLVGVQLHYAWFTLDLAIPGFPTTAVSNAVPLTFEVDTCLAFAGAPDCNGNGIVDACDIADGIAFDCNGNGVLDECELLAGGVDADLDGILDACQTVVFVDAAAVGTGDGSSWADAFVELREALVAAPPFAQIWVAAGTYTPWPNGDNQGASFMLRDTIGVYGGFVGGETSLDQRDWQNFAPTLTGDVLLDDGAPGGGILDNAWNVVQASAKVGPTGVLDGFRITAGNAIEVAGCDVYAVYFSSCRGGGIYAEGSPTIRNCTVEGNFGGHHGGGAYVLRDPRFVNCLFTKNSAIRGAGIYCDVGARPILQDCRLVQNEAQFGGGLFATGNATDGPRLIDCTLVGNTAAEQGGAAYLEVAPAVFENVTVVSNRCFTTGGGIYSDFGASVVLRNSILWGNTGTGGAGGQVEQLQGQGGAPSVEWCIIDGWNGSLGGVGNGGADPQFVDVDGLDNFAGNLDDDLRLASGSPARDAGDTAQVAPDLFDLDGDGDTAEPKPFDIDGNPRLVDDPVAPNTGLTAAGSGPVDLGAHEG